MKHKKSSNEAKIYKDFLKLYEADRKQNKKLTKNQKNRLSSQILSDFENVSKLKSSKKDSMFVSKNYIDSSKIKNEDKGSRIKQDFFLSKPKLVNDGFLIPENFSKFIIEKFDLLIREFINNKKTYKKDHNRFFSLGYHFYFQRGKEKTYQSGFRPRYKMNKNNTNIDKVLRIMYIGDFNKNGTYDIEGLLPRFNAYFNTRLGSKLYFEGVTCEISFGK